MTRPCALATLPENPDRADLDAAYAMRGAQIVSCDAARRLAVETLMAERVLQDRWARGLERRPNGLAALFRRSARQD